MWRAGSNRLASFSQNVVRQSRDARGHLECICETSVALIRWEWARLVFCIDFLHEVVFVVVLIHSYSVSSVLHEGMVAAVCFSGFLMGLSGGLYVQCTMVSRLICRLPCRSVLSFSSTVWLTAFSSELTAWYKNATSGLGLWHIFPCLSVTLYICYMCDWTWGQEAEDWRCRECSHY